MVRIVPLDFNDRVGVDDHIKRIERIGQAQALHYWSRQPFLIDQTISIGCYGNHSVLVFQRLADLLSHKDT